ncbi:hypothetical protein [Flavobacterium sp. W20_MBD1_R3]|uniref:hypothetical protein n=1 Tax=Flavobacterium sp. W20_MBD1_R3 TaxID=3240278 RepID=UPI003F92980D
MSTIKILFFIALLFVVSFSTISFIKISNDHLECDTILKRELDKNGFEVTKQEHVCNEKYSL